MSSNFQNLLWAFSGMLAVLCCGCSRSQPEHAEILGFVTLDGQPVEQAAVYLAPCSHKHGEGVVGSVTEGLFEFSGTKGPAPGSYEVILKPIEPDAEEVLAEVQEQRRKSPLLEARNKFLKAVQKKGPVIVEVTMDPANEIEIELSSR